jgi:HAD superfamily hydrolase (TIGR01509 family)
MRDEIVSLPHALLFDMDGTLTEPMLDFPAIKADMGLRPDQAILEAMADMDDARRAAAAVVLDRHEKRTAERSTLNPGCRDVLAWAASRGLPTALITRNSGLSMRTVLAKHKLSFDVLVSRDHGTPKPDPWPVRLACEQLGTTPANAWMIGDGRYDVEAGHAAGARTVWISHGKVKHFPTEPWRTVPDLMGLLELLREAR